MVNRITEQLKWYIGLLSALMLPFVMLAYCFLYASVDSLSHAQIAFFICVIMGYFVCETFFLDGWIGQLYETLEHELCHAIVAIITGNRVGNIQVKENGTGSISIYGKGNWLVKLAPYCLPLSSITVAGFVAATGAASMTMPSALIGLSCGYNLSACFRQLGSYQSDIRKSGIPFASCFLPSAILVPYFAILALVASPSDPWRTAVSACGEAVGVLIALLPG